MKGLIKFSLVLVVLIVALFVLTEKVNANPNCYNYSVSEIFRYKLVTGAGGINNHSPCGAKAVFYTNLNVSNHNGTFDYGFVTREFNYLGRKCWREGCIKNTNYNGYVYTDIVANNGFYLRRYIILDYLVP